MDQLLKEYNIQNIKIINERSFAKDNKNIIVLLYELYLLTKESNEYDNNKTK